VPIRADDGDPRSRHTVLRGKRTDDEIVGYCVPTPLRAFGPPWREVVDGGGIAEMAVTLARQPGPPA
jgi:hypothetical protein